MRNVQWMRAGACAAFLAMLMSPARALPGQETETEPIEGAEMQAPAEGDTLTDPEIAAIVIAANEVDAAAGELAADEATNPRVRAFGEQMVEAHTAVNEKVEELAGQLRIEPEDNPVAEDLRRSGEQNRENLEELEEGQFDQAYIAHEIAYHQKVLDVMDGVLIPSAESPELEGLLVSVRPAFVSHLEQARQIQGTLRGGMAMGQDGMAGEAAMEDQPPPARMEPRMGEDVDDVEDDANAKVDVLDAPPARRDTDDRRGVDDRGRMQERPMEGRADRGMGMEHRADMMRNMQSLQQQMDELSRQMNELQRQIQELQALMRQQQS